MSDDTIFVEIGMTAAAKQFNLHSRVSELRLLRNNDVPASPLSLNYFVVSELNLNPLIERRRK